jgi:hypothetical protein
MASENAQPGRTQSRKPTSENRTRPATARRGRPPVRLPAGYATIRRRYTEKLATAPLSAQTRRTYESKVRQYLAWLAAANLDGDPFKDKHGRDCVPNEPVARRLWLYPPCRPVRARRLLFRGAVRAGPSLLLRAMNSSRML